MKIQKIETRYGKMFVMISDQVISKSLIEYGEWSHDEIQLLEQFIKPGMKVLDIGANVGSHTLAFSKATGLNGLVLSFEPQPVVFGLLAVNMVENDATNVLVFNAAVGDAAGWLDLPHINYTKPNNYGAFRFGTFLVNNEKNINRTPIPVYRLDDLKLAESAHVIKIDVEGMEAAVLRGARGLIAKSRPIMLIENETPGKESEEMLSLLFEMEYDAYWQAGHIFEPNNFNKNKKNFFPNQACMNVLALPRESPVKINGKKVTDATEHPRKET